MDPYSKDFILGGSWVGKNGVISRVTLLTTHLKGLITPLVATREPPSQDYHRDPDIQASFED